MSPNDQLESIIVARVNLLLLAAFILLYVWRETRRK